jgi:hypothetical protein
MALPAPVNVSVNLDVLVDATGNISVFGQAPTTMTNVGAAAVTMPVSCLYNGLGNSLIKFQGTTVATVDDIAATLAKDTFLGANATEAKLADAIKAVLSGSINTSAVLPFSTYSGVPEYHQQANFGRLALGAYAHSLFGHVAATAAIDNDVAFVNKMIGDGAGDAGLNKSLAALIYGLSDAKCTAIAKQVLGQDASRAKGIDNDANLPSGFQALEFKANDTVYFSIKLVAPTVSVSGVGGAAAQQSEPLGSAHSDMTYVIAVKLA